jgi:uncharacterized protein (TIGR02266 family)
VTKDKGERRGHFRGKPRPGRRVQVRYQATGHQGAGSEEQRAHTKNIGVGGAFILTARPLKVGTHLRLVVDMPVGTPIEVRAEVRWVVAPALPGAEGPTQDPGMGVRFAGLDVEQLLALNEYFASLTATIDHG